MTSSTATRALAITGAIGCFGIAVGLLFGGVPSWDSLTLGKVVSAGVLGVAIILGHVVYGLAREGRWLKASVGAVLAIVATGLVVVGTAGRNTESAATKAETGKIARAAHARAMEDVTSARGILKAAYTQRDEAIKAQQTKVDDAQAALAKACADGAGSKCRGASATLRMAQDVLATTKSDDAVVRMATDSVAHREAAAAKLDLPADTSDARAFATILWTLGFVGSVAAAEAVISVLVPFAAALVIEVAGAYLLAVAFPAVPLVQIEPASRPIAGIEAPTSIPALEAVTVPVTTATPTIRFASVSARVTPAAWSPASLPAKVDEPDNAFAALSADLWSDGAVELYNILCQAPRAMTVTEAAGAMDVSVSEASRRASELGDAIARKRAGREVYMSANLCC